MSYGNLGGPFFALRVEAEGKTIACTGDTEWTDTLIDAGKDADLFIADAYYYENKSASTSELGNNIREAAVD